ncbi:hypothetical protein TPA0910_39140 [Streptomyces hygroscopicus subsp. sporocinereus]|uniref:Integrase n=1 Tax=Streptomyces hygroscopicus TaxID=1912 RepID=A0ABQ3U2I9_STRHY|nr:hypothetical protein [Streptomyces hygroscopicus]GHJ29481.1 hypothetical protein TPA0910_39140 [Streptomyces hygroscopicus]
MIYKVHLMSEKRARTEAALVKDPGTGETVDLTQREDEAFWSWAVIETLRHTGIRREELLEITHLALVSCRMADSGELVPLLQILPSKNNREWLLLVSPELASRTAGSAKRKDSRSASKPQARSWPPWIGLLRAAQPASLISGSRRSGTERGPRDQDASASHPQPVSTGGLPPASVSRI